MHELINYDIISLFNEPQLLELFNHIEQEKNYKP